MKALDQEDPKGKRTVTHLPAFLLAVEALEGMEETVEEVEIPVQTGKPTEEYQCMAVMEETLAVADMELLEEMAETVGTVEAMNGAKAEMAAMEAAADMEPPEEQEEKAVLGGLGVRIEEEMAEMAVAEGMVPMVPVEKVEMVAAATVETVEREETVELLLAAAVAAAVVDIETKTPAAETWAILVPEDPGETAYV